MLPQHHLLNNVTRRWGTFSWHWFFMVQPYPLPETMISADPEFFIRRKLSKTDRGTSLFDPRALAEYIRCIKDPKLSTACARIIAPPSASISTWIPRISTPAGKSRVPP
jgi:haloacetate dehalogenase